ncbi:MAG: hypothetical protein HRF43_19540 [Phycisphaerae bacterium]
MTTTRREAIGGMAGMMGGLGLSAAAMGQVPPAAPRPGADQPESLGVSVTAFGARGDGATDCAEAFDKALKAAGNSGGAVVYVPAGRYRLSRPIELPDHVTLQGVHRDSPPNRAAGSVLLADVEPADDGKPFITLHAQSTLSGLCVHYPRQDDPAAIKPFPWCVRGVADNATIINCLLTNPYRGVDFGTVTGGRHFIDGLYAQPLYRGLFIDKCYDVGRVRNVHFWPFWNQKARPFMETRGEAFVIGKTDWQMIDFCFCIWYRVGFHFVANQPGPGNTMLTNSGSDIGPTAVRIDQLQPHAGITWVNGQFMSGIEVSEANNGPVKFTACGFWGVNENNLHCASHAVLAGGGTVSFDSCHFTQWDVEKKGAPAIDADCRSVAVRNCDFLDADKRQIRLGDQVKSAIITGNRLRGGAKIQMPAGRQFTIGLNAEA